jgi:hypothetical protein
MSGSPAATNTANHLLLAHAGHAEDGSVLPGVLMLLLLAGVLLLVAAAAGRRRPDSATVSSDGRA